MKLWPFSRKPKTKRRRFPRTRGYQSAQTGRLVADWNLSGASADADIIPNLRTLRDRSRDLWQNNDYAKRFIHLLKTNVVGHRGVLFKNRARDANGEADRDANDRIEAAWKTWGQRGETTMCGGYSWLALQLAVIETVARDGEVLLQKVRAGEFGLRLHIMEADRLDDQLNVPTKRIKGGVELDDWGRPVRYYLLQSHPGESYGTVNREPHRVVPASEIIHLYVRERPGQTRGVPWLVTPAFRLKQLGAIEDAELVASRIGASKMGFFYSEDGDQYAPDDEESDGSLITEAEPGTFEQLPSGMKFEAWDPQHPNSALDPFSKLLLRGIASGLNVSYVALANDLKGVSYSSIRQGELSDRDAWRLFQTWLVENFIEVVYRDWFPSAMLSGEVGLPARKADKFNRPTWMPRGWTWVDPAKETAAQINAISNGLRSLTDVAAEQGYSVEDVFERLAAEQKLAEEYGLKLPLFGQAAPPPAELDDEPGDDDEDQDDDD